MVDRKLLPDNYVQYQVDSFDNFTSESASLQNSPIPSMPSASSQKSFAYHFFERLPARITFGGGVSSGRSTKIQEGVT
jgi:hypothetical protein